MRELYTQQGKMLNSALDLSCFDSRKLSRYPVLSLFLSFFFPFGCLRESYTLSRWFIAMALKSERSAFVLPREWRGERWGEGMSGLVFRRLCLALYVPTGICTVWNTLWWSLKVSVKQACLAADKRLRRNPIPFEKAQRKSETLNIYSKYLGIIIIEMMKK